MQLLSFPSLPSVISVLLYSPLWHFRSLPYLSPLWCEEVKKRPKAIPVVHLALLDPPSTCHICLLFRIVIGGVPLRTLLGVETFFGLAIVQSSPSVRFSCIYFHYNNEIPFVSKVSKQPTFMADFLEDDDPSDLAEHRFGQQEWDRLEESFVNVRPAT